MPGIGDPAAAMIVVERMLQSLAEAFLLPGGEGQVSGSVGIAFYPKDGTDSPTLLKNADSAMYRAKEKGRNSYCFYSPAIRIDSAS
ncbi:MAG: GGDEF domain-containing protein [Desulfuromonadales bacterium]|nr:GGDEF domain-containing protein [Desulfuromonadales bacterium]